MDGGEKGEIRIEVMGCSIENIYEIDEFRFPVSIVSFFFFSMWTIL